MLDETNEFGLLPAQFQGLGAMLKAAGLKVVKKTPETTDLTERARAERRISLIRDEGIKAALQGGQMTFRDYEIYAVKAAGAGTTVEVFQSGQAKSVGTTNIDNAKLPSGRYYFVTEITVLTGTGTGITEVTFSTPEKAVLNGNWTLKHGSKIIIDKSGANCFADAGTAAFKKSTLVLGSPLLLSPETLIELNLDLAQAAASNAYIKVILKGQMTYPA